MDCALGHFYRRKKAHLGPAKAITATARKLACIVYLMLKNKQEYREPDPVAYEAKIQKSRLSHLKSKLHHSALNSFQLHTEGLCSKTTRFWILQAAKRVVALEKLKNDSFLDSTSCQTRRCA